MILVDFALMIDSNLETNKNVSFFEFDEVRLDALWFHGFYFQLYLEVIFNNKLLFPVIFLLKFKLYR